MCVTAVSAGCKFPIYCCPVNFKTAEKSNPKPFSIGLRVFFFKDQAPESQIMMVGFAAGGRTRAEWACPKRVVQRRRVPLFLWKKNKPLLLLLSVPTPKGESPSCKCLPIGRNSVFGACSDRKGSGEVAMGSASQRAFAPEGREKFLDFALYGHRSAAG